MNKLNRHLDEANKLVGKKFERLTVIKVLDRRTKDGHIMVRCLCVCGNEMETRAKLVKNKTTRSCGCLQKEICSKNLKKAQAVQFKLEPRIASAKKTYRSNYSDGNLSFGEFLELSQKKCFYCELEPSNNSNLYIGKYMERHPSSTRAEEGSFIYSGLDRIDSSKPHDRDNVVPCCSKCNTAKLDRTLPEFFDWINTVYQLHVKGSKYDIVRFTSISSSCSTSIEQSASRF